MLRPDYAGGGFANLIASIVEACGGKPRHAPLSALPAAELAQASNVVLLIIDGLGDHYLRREGAGGALLSRRCGAITSVFPSTTASAITTAHTGWTPLEHGLTGWFTLFGAAGCVGAPLPFQRRGEIVDQPLETQDGYVSPPTRPGIGVELIEEVAAAHPGRSPEPHLVFAPDGALLDW